MMKNKAYSWIMEILAAATLIFVGWAINTDWKFIFIAALVGLVIAKTNVEAKG